MYGLLTPKMRDTLRTHVQGRIVWDLGAGDLGYSNLLLTLGASKVIAIDKADMPPGSPGIECRRGYFQDLAMPDMDIEVVFLSWPQNNTLWGLYEILERTTNIIYLGSNTGGSACGTPALYTQLALREVIAHVPHPRNSFIVYGGRATTPRTLLAEEWAALHQEQVWTIEEATRASQGCP